MSEIVRKERTPQDAIVLLARGFTGLLTRIDSERERQLTDEGEYRLFLAAYDKSYPDLYRRLANDYRSSSRVSPNHPLELIRRASDVKHEAEKQALLLIGYSLLELSKNENMTRDILDDIAFHNEIKLPEDPIDTLHSIRFMLEAPLQS
jgi:hypothetical protein